LARDPWRLQARHDADGKIVLPRQRANGDGDGAGRHEGDLAEQAAPVETVGAEPLGDGEHHLSVRHRREQRRVEPLGPDRQALGQGRWGSSSGTCTRTRADADFTGTPLTVGTTCTAMVSTSSTYWGVFLTDDSFADGVAFLQGDPISFFDFVFEVNGASVLPEPASGALLAAGAGLFGVAVGRRRRSR
jgi:hypothetical protein